MTFLRVQTLEIQHEQQVRKCCLLIIRVSKEAHVSYPFVYYCRIGKRWLVGRNWQVTWLKVTTWKKLASCYLLHCVKVIHLETAFLASSCTFYFVIPIALHLLHWNG